LVPWPEAVERVIGSYAAFSEELASVARPFFVRPWIDAALRPGKSGGAFAHPTVPLRHPYLLLNYLRQAARRDDLGARAGATASTKCSREGRVICSAARR
jgi:oligoendopeptidase F